MGSWDHGIVGSWDSGIENESEMRGKIRVKLRLADRGSLRKNSFSCLLVLIGDC